MVVMTLSGSASDEYLDAGRLLHDFNREYDEPAAPPEQLAERLAMLTGQGQVVVLVAHATTTEPGEPGEPGEPVGVAVLRVQPSIHGPAEEAYLAELYVVPARRGQGYGRELITETLRVARERGADYAYLITTEEDRLAQRLYEAAGFRRTEGDDGAIMLAYERDL